MKLSDNFSLKEMIKSQTATRKDIDNEPGEEEIENLKLLCENVLQPVRENYGKAVRVNSGYRSPELNSAIGGSRTSDHCKGFAADIEINGVANAELAEWIESNCDFKQLILEFYKKDEPNSGWIHVSWNGEKNRNSVLKASREEDKVIYKPW